MKPTNRPPILWPTNNHAALFPAPPDGERLVALTVFTEYPLPNGGLGATCVCGGLYRNALRQNMRKDVAGHRCSDQVGGPVGPLPPGGGDEPDDDMLQRILDRLRLL